MKKSRPLILKITLFIVLPAVLAAVTVFSLNIYFYRHTETLVQGYMTDNARKIVERETETFEDLGELMENYVVSNSDFITMISTKNDSERYSKKHAALTDLNTVIFTDIDSVFVYIESTGEFADIPRQADHFYERQELGKTLSEMLSDHSQKRRKNIVLFGGDMPAFVMIVPGSRGTAGFYIMMDRLTAHMGLRDLGGTFFVTQNGTPVYWEGEEIPAEKEAAEAFFNTAEKNRKYFVLDTDFVAEGTKIRFLFDRSILQKELRTQMVFMALVSIVVIGVFIILFVSLYRFILNPVRKMMEFSLRVKEDPGLRLEGATGTSEFDRLYESYNQTLDNLTETQKQLAEEQIEKTQAEYNFLRTQINPHFFMNLLNTMYSLVISDQKDLTLDMIEYMSSYYRYVLRRKESVAALEEELTSVKEYLEIQNIRFPGKIRWTFNVEEDARQVKIPILSLMTFTENIMEHAFSGEEIHICISVSLENDRIRILIEDDGPGFTEERIGLFNQDLAEGAEEKRERGVGMLNVKRRLKILYHDQADVRLYNKPEGGACVFMAFPASVEG